MLNNPNRIIRKKEKPFAGQQTDQYKFLRLGVITNVDYENNLTSINWVDSPGGSIEIPISHPYAGKRSHITTMPESGSLVICGYIKQTQTTGKPVILSYMPQNYAEALNYVLDRGNYGDDDRIKLLETDLDNSGITNFIEEKIAHEVIRHKKRKIYPGEIQLESQQGSEMYIHSDIQIMNANLNELTLRNADQHIILNSVNQTIITNAGRIKNGIITRNLKSDFSALTDNVIDIANNAPFQKPIYLPNGKPLFVVTTDGNQLNESDVNTNSQVGGGAFTEIRTELSETFDMRLRVTEETSEVDIDAPEKKPFITQVLGTLVGNDPSDQRTYGKVLRPQVFDSPNSTVLSLDEIPITESPELYKVLAGAYHLRFKNIGVSANNVGVRFNNRTSFTVDKEGHLFVNVSASRSHPHGSGRSIEMNTEGSVKLVIGANKLLNDSLNLDTFGRITANIGKDNTNDESLNISTNGGIKLNINGVNKNSNSIEITTSGTITETVKGDRYLTVEGDYKLDVTGVIEEVIRGTKIESYIGDKHTAYGGDYSLAIYGQLLETINEKHITSISGNIINPTEIVNQINITQGTDKLYILRGDSKIEILNGNIYRNINIGNYENNITFGDYKVNVSSGSIEIKTSLGSVTISGSTDVSITGPLTVNISGSTAVTLNTNICNVNASSIFLGNNATQPAVKGFELLSWMASHLHGSSMGPTTPPVNPPMPSLLSTNVFLQ